MTRTKHLTVDARVLMKMSPSQRNSMMRDSTFRDAILSSLTPYQIAMMFPDYYKRWQGLSGGDGSGGGDLASMLSGLTSTKGGGGYSGGDGDGGVAADGSTTKPSTSTATPARRNAIEEFLKQSNIEDPALKYNYGAPAGGGIGKNVGRESRVPSTGGTNNYPLSQRPGITSPSGESKSSTTKAYGKRIDRSEFAEQLKDPETMAMFAGRMSTEVGSQGRAAQIAWAETTFNRAAARGLTLKQAVSGAYFPTSNPKRSNNKVFHDIINEVQTTGSNTTDGATGNSSGTVGFGNHGKVAIPEGAKKIPGKGYAYRLPNGKIWTPGQKVEIGGERYGVEEKDRGWKPKYIEEDKKQGPDQTQPQPTTGTEEQKTGVKPPSEAQQSDMRAGLNEKSKLQTYASKKTTGALGVDQRQYNAYKEALASIESSGGNYGLIGGAGNKYTGAYQFGEAAMRDCARELGIEVPTRKQFLADPQMQELFLDTYTSLNHETLMKFSPEYREMTPEQKLGVLGYAHNQGAGGAQRWLETGVVGADAFGTKGTAYTSAIAAQLEKTKDISTTIQQKQETSASNLYPEGYDKLNMDLQNEIASMSEVDRDKLLKRMNDDISKGEDPIKNLNDVYDKSLKNQTQPTTAQPDGSQTAGVTPTQENTAEAIVNKATVSDAEDYMKSYTNPKTGKTYSMPEAGSGKGVKKLQEPFKGGALFSGNSGSTDKYLKEAIAGGAIRAFGDPADPNTRYVVHVQGGFRGGAGRHGANQAVDLQIYDRKLKQYASHVKDSDNIFRNAFDNPFTYKLYHELGKGAYLYSLEHHGKSIADTIDWGGGFSAEGHAGSNINRFQTPDFRNTDTMHYSRNEGMRYISKNLSSAPDQRAQEYLAKYGQGAATGIPGKTTEEMLKYKSPYLSKPSGSDNIAGEGAAGEGTAISTEVGIPQIESNQTVQPPAPAQPSTPENAPAQGSPQTSTTTPSQTQSSADVKSEKTSAEVPQKPATPNKPTATPVKPKITKKTDGLGLPGFATGGKMGTQADNLVVVDPKREAAGKDGAIARVRTGETVSLSGGDMRVSPDQLRPPAKMENQSLSVAQQSPQQKLQPQRTTSVQGGDKGLVGLTGSSYAYNNYSSSSAERAALRNNFKNPGESHRFGTWANKNIS